MILELNNIMSLAKLRSSIYQMSLQISDAYCNDLCVSSLKGNLL